MSPRVGIGDYEREQMQWVFIIFGFLGLFSITVVVTPILFKKFRDYFFLRILAIISFCDTMTAISYIINLGRINLQDLRNDKLCRFQGVLNTFSINASISWTVALSVQLYSIVKIRKPFFSWYSLHILFWSLPIGVEVFPLFFKCGYGMDDVIPDMALGSCNIRTGYPGSDAGHMAFDINIYVFKIAAFTILVIFFFLTQRQIDLNKAPELREVTRVTSTCTGPVMDSCCRVANFAIFL